MRINSINPYTNTYPRIKKSDKSAPAFGAWDGESIIKARKHLATDKMFHTTLLFRNAKFWPEFSKHVQNKFPNGVNIHSYAASDGSESYSIIMKLIDDIGEARAKKYFPIYSNDISKEAVNQMKKRELEIAQYEEDENIFINLKNKNILDYFEDKGKSEKYPWGNHILKAKDNLYSNIRPKRADIMKDLDDNSKFADPCVVFFRNAWYFFSDKGRYKLAEKLYSKLKSGSSLIIGEVDHSTIPPILEKNGFSPLIQNGVKSRFIFERP